MLAAKNLPNSFFGSYFGKKPLMVSLNAKLNACVGKYRMTFTVLPRQNAMKPCSLDTRVKQSTMPVYRATSPEMIFGLASCVWISSFTRSIGAVAVFATAIFGASSSVTAQAWVDDSDRDEFEEKATTPYLLAVVQLPFRAMVGVYGPLLMTVQLQRTWGLMVLATFIVVWLPLYIAAVKAGEVALLVGANLAYDAVHLAFLAAAVHLKGIPMVRAGQANLESMPSSATATSTTDPVPPGRTLDTSTVDA